MSKKFFVSFILKKVHFALTDPLVNIKKVAKTMLKKGLKKYTE